MEVPAHEAVANFRSARSRTAKCELDETPKSLSRSPAAEQRSHTRCDSARNARERTAARTWSL